MKFLPFLLLLLLLISCTNNDTPKPPNIILIMTDDQGYGDLSIHGNDSVSTPVLDRLAKEGVQFDRFYVSPLCAPTRASLLTGRYHMRTGTSWVTHRKEVMRAEETTIAEVFKNAGYTTGIFGKWHNGEQYPNTPQGQGFDEFYGFKAGHWNNYFNTKLEHNGQEVQGEGFIIDDLTNQAMTFIENNKNQPFFAYLPYNTPHSPFQVPDDLYDKYKATGLTDKNACVYAMCENIDNNIGRLWDKVASLGLEDNTIIIFLTDNGPNGRRYNGNMRGTKGSVHEGGMRVPLFMYWKGNLPAGKMITELAAHIDLLPTLADLADITLPTDLNLDGKSLTPLLLSEDTTWDARTLHHLQSDGKLEGYRAAVRTDQYRLVINNDQTVELYDMLADPRQTTDLADQLPDIYNQLLDKHKAWFADVTKNGIAPPPIPVGYAASPTTHLPAPESTLSGNLKFKGKMGWANDWIYGWANDSDVATWNIDVVENGKFEVLVDYASIDENIGSTIFINNGEAELSQQVAAAHWPAYYESPDKVKRGEVYEKDWKPLSLGTLDLAKGSHKINLYATGVATSDNFEIKTVSLKKVE